MPHSTLNIVGVKIFCSFTFGSLNGLLLTNIRKREECLLLTFEVVEADGELQLVMRVLPLLGVLLKQGNQIGTSLATHKGISFLICFSLLPREPSKELQA